MNFILWTIFFVIFALTLYIIVPSVFKIIFRKNCLKKVKKNNQIYFTFDDGPNPESTPKILDLLNKYNAKATFFVTGKNAEKYPDLIKDIIRMGHDIGSHGYNHLHAWKIDPFSSLKDFFQFSNIINKLELPIKKVILYRPPYGKLNLVILLYIFITGKKYFFWNIDPKDYSELSSDTVAEFVITRLKPGSVILLHDGRSKASNSSSEITIKALELILQSSLKKDIYFSLFSVK